MFRSVFIDAKISNPKTGNSASLSMADGSAEIPFLENFKLGMVRGTNMNMSIDLAPPYENALELISKDSEWLRIGNTVGVRWGYADHEGMISDWNYGFMQQPQVHFGEEITITVEATTLAWNMNKIAKFRDWASTESPRSLLSIAIEIAERYGLGVEYAVIGENTKEMMEHERSSFVQGGRTDMQFLMYEIENCDARMIIQNDKIFIIDESAPLPGYPDVNATFELYGQIDTTRNVFPMTGFDTETMGVLFIRNFQGTMAVPFGPNSDPEKAVETVKKTDAASSSNSFSADKTLSSPSEDGNPAVDMEDIKTKATVTTEGDPEEAGRAITLPLGGDETESFINAQVSAAQNASADEHGITATFSALALPNLLPGMYVRLAGVGDYFSSVYMLNEVNLDVGLPGASMNCGCFGRGFPTASDAIEAMASNVETSKEPREGSGLDTETVEAVEQ